MTKTTVQITGFYERPNTHTCGNSLGKSSSLLMRKIKNSIILQLQMISIAHNKSNTTTQSHPHTTCSEGSYTTNPHLSVPFHCIQIIIIYPLGSKKYHNQKPSNKKGNRVHFRDQDTEFFSSFSPPLGF